MNTDPENMAIEEKKLTAYRQIQEILNLLQGSSRIEQIYLAIDRIVKLTVEIYPETGLMLSSNSACCTNGLSPPVSFLEWKSVENYLNNKVGKEVRNKIRENILKIPEELFIADLKSQAQPEPKKFKNIVCPLLINNICAINPYRPLSCRIQGVIDSEKIISLTGITGFQFETELCQEEMVIPTNREIFISLIKECKVTLENMNKSKPSKLMIVWLKEYFYPNI